MKYIPIFRFENTERTLLDEINNKENIMPLLEITNENLFSKEIPSLCEKFDDIMVELPLYLSARANKHQSSVLKIINNFSSDDDPQVSFYKNYKKSKIYNLRTENHPDLNFIPVLSTLPSDNTYSNFIKKYNDLKNIFNKIAIRFFIYSNEITEIQKNAIKNIVKLTRDNDIILLDVLGFENIEGIIHNNLKIILELIGKKEKYILNAFDYNGHSNTHNYGPLLSKEFNITGFGDFSTLVRYDASGGSGEVHTKKIRFYVYNNNTLIHFQHSSKYDGAVKQLKQSEFWKEIIKKESNHLSVCSYCNVVTKDYYENTPTWWKKYRIMHYINSVINHVIPNTLKYKDSEDFDPDGYNDIVKKSGTISKK